MLTKDFDLAELALPTFDPKRMPASLRMQYRGKQFKVLHSEPLEQGDGASYTSKERNFLLDDQGELYVANLSFQAENQPRIIGSSVEALQSKHFEQAKDPKHPQITPEMLLERMHQAMPLEDEELTPLPKQGKKQKR